MTCSSPVVAPLGAMRVGNDQCRAADIHESIAAFGDRFLDRVFTPAERDYAESAPASGLRDERFAARFAAKEAVVKVLRPVEERPEWRSIEVVRSPHGWCDIALTGTAAAFAAAEGIASLSVSLSHDGGMAAAVVVAQLSHPETHCEESHR